MFKREVHDENVLACMT